MISSRLGEVQFTQPDYKVGDKLGASHEDVEVAVKSILYADLSCILDALIDQYGLTEMLEIWTKVAEGAVEERENA